jgi:hypothetical protein
MSFSVNSDQYTWDNRRRVMYAVLVFCAGVIVYVLQSARTDAVADNAITMSFFTMGGIVGSYVFGAAWQDINHMKVTGTKFAPRPDRDRKDRPGLRDKNEDDNDR